jgi:hypothetical protein
VNVALFTSPLSPSAGCIRFSNDKMRRSRGGWFICTAAVEADGETWSTRLDMIDHYRAEMLAFFEDVAEEASAGWEGELRWDSECGRMQILATASGDGHVQFRVSVSQRHGLDEKRAQLTFATEAVERFGKDIRGFLRMTDGDPRRRTTRRLEM